MKNARVVTIQAVRPPVYIDSDRSHYFYVTRNIHREKSLEISAESYEYESLTTRTRSTIRTAVGSFRVADKSPLSRRSPLPRAYSFLFHRTKTNSFARLSVYSSLFFSISLGLLFSFCRVSFTLYL